MARSTGLASRVIHRKSAEVREISTIQQYQKLRGVMTLEISDIEKYWNP